MRLHIQLIRYALVGLTSNTIGYLLYLLLTHLGVGHKTAMTIVYGVGVIQAFYFNRSWTFAHDGKILFAFIRHVIVYGGGYILNLALLILLVDHLGWPHEGVQAMAIFVIAACLFVAQKIWVYSPATRRNEV